MRIVFVGSSRSAPGPSPSLSGAFVPTVSSDVGPYVDGKIELMAMHEAEAQPDPMPRAREAIRALARTHDVTAGLEYAEAFMLIREIS